MSHRLRNAVWMVSSSSKPAIPMGIVPTMMYQPIRASRWPRSSGRTSDLDHVVMMRQMSFWKNQMTAARYRSA